MRELRPHTLFGGIGAALLCLSLAACTGSGGRMTSPDEPGLVATYSIVAADVKRGELGVAVQSKFFSVGSVVPWARAGVGAVASQAFANPLLGREGLQRMARGESPETALAALLAEDENAARRQAGMVNAKGEVAAHTGAECHAFAGHRPGRHYVVQGNLLAGPEVLAAMAETFERRRAAGDRLDAALVAALQAGEDAGGDRRGRQSAALLVVREDGGYQGVDDRLIDLRVEDHPDPTKELTRLLEIHRSFFKDRHMERVDGAPGDRK